MAEQQMRDQTLLEVIDSQLAASGELIFKRRQKLTEALLPLANSHYQDIAQKPEPLSINYESQLLQTSFMQWLQNNRERDLFLQRTNAGIHKDDLRFELDEKLFRQVASQGQRKSLLFALKIAEYDLLKKTNGFAPLMLLDDVFEKLDEQRMQNLLYKVCEERQGQVFITDTHETRLNEAFAKLKSASAIHTLVSGSVVKETNISSQ
jgi:DNA replication and repair protein RecF